MGGGLCRDEQPASTIPTTSQHTCGIRGAPPTSPHEAQQTNLLLRGGGLLERRSAGPLLHDCMDA
eukprot:8254251-Pyramimonas_sp.AAC.1